MSIINGSNTEILNSSNIISPTSNLIKLQSILLPTDLCSEEKVYYHAHEDGITVDFDGYFNLFYIEKRKRYTSIANLLLVLRLEGYKKIALMHDREELSSLEIDNPHEITEYRLQYPYTEYDNGVFWFRLTKESEKADTYIEGYYAGKTDQKRKAKVFIDICTYKREEYVCRNMKRLTSFLEREENREISENLHIVLIDNGQSLDSCQELQRLIGGYPQIEVIPNANTGGAGGFTRGMEEAIARKEKDGYTHVLLMDDDASFHTDLFVRLFGVLTTLKEDYKNLTIGGAMWREDYPFVQHAAGEWYEKMTSYCVNQTMDMRSFDLCTQKEMCTTENELHRFSGWWCCCYSLNIVRQDNLPLKQLFIHIDDIEYEKRNRLAGNPVAFFNGIGVWHKPFDSEFLGIKRYYNIRNGLIQTSLHEKDVSSFYIKKKLIKQIVGCGLGNRYMEMHLAYMGYKDFLKGPEWLETLDTEAHHKALIKYVRDYEKAHSISDLSDPRIAPVRKRVLELLEKEPTLDEVIEAGKRKNEKPGLIPMITLNGKIIPYRKHVVLITTVDTYLEKGYRYNRFLFIQRQPRKLVYVNTKITEILNMMKMVLTIASLNMKNNLI